jgi:hypothetical protein
VSDLPFVSVVIVTYLPLKFFLGELRSNDHLCAGVLRIGFFATLCTELAWWQRVAASW